MHIIFKVEGGLEAGEEEELGGEGGHGVTVGGGVKIPAEEDRDRE